MRVHSRLCYLCVQSLSCSLPIASCVYVLMVFNFLPLWIKEFVLRILIASSLTFLHLGPFAPVIIKRLRDDKKDDDDNEEERF